MTKGTTMKIVGYFACNPDTLRPEWGEDCVCQDDVYDPEETGTVGRPFVFAAEAEAYADARVREALEEAAMILKANAESCNIDTAIMLRANAEAILALMPKENKS